MKLKTSLLLLSIISFGLFVLISYSVAKEAWQKIDFDITVKLQDHIPTKYDDELSYFSLLGSGEVTFALSLILAVLNLIRLKVGVFLGWLMIIPASIMEILGKLFIFHPGTPVLFHRFSLETTLPSFYIHTNFSYPSGHTTRSVFLLTVLVVLTLTSKNDLLVKAASIVILLVIGVLMSMTRISLGEHWLSDVVGGSLLGLAFGLFASILILPKTKA